MDKNRKEDFKRCIPELYPRLHRAMTAYLAGSSVEADDILQETFLKAYHHLDSFEGKSGYYTWLYSIARNLCIDEFRKRKHEKARSSLPVEEYILPSDLFTTDEKREDILLLRKAIAQLPELLRSVVIMFTIDGMTYPEIAGVTGINEQTIKNRMFRARKELAVMLKKMGVDQS
jgi:RNA polymerase sigma-70 factor (ECF subfamily)